MSEEKPTPEEEEAIAEIAEGVREDLLAGRSRKQVARGLTVGGMHPQWAEWFVELIAERMEKAEVTPEYRKLIADHAQRVVSQIAEGKDKEDIRRGLVASGTSEESAKEFVDDVEAAMDVRWRRSARQRQLAGSCRTGVLVGGAMAVLGVVGSITGATLMWPPIVAGVVLVLMCLVWLKVVARKS